jgi:hypothetical protein
VIVADRRDHHFIGRALDLAGVGRTAIPRWRNADIRGRACRSGGTLCTGRAGRTCGPGFATIAFCTRCSRGAGSARYAGGSGIALGSLIALWAFKTTRQRYRRQTGDNRHSDAHDPPPRFILGKSRRLIADVNAARPQRSWHFV